MSDETRLDVKVLKGSVRIATANVTDSDSGTYCQNVEVARAHQRRGIATAMYVLAELIFQKTLLRYWTSDQHSSAADAFWAQPNRPFSGAQPTSRTGFSLSWTSTNIVGPSRSSRAQRLYFRLRKTGFVEFFKSVYDRLADAFFVVLQRVAEFHDSTLDMDRPFTRAPK